VPGEGRVGSSEPGEAPAARSAHAGGSVTLGLIAAPDIPEKISKELAADLPKLLSSNIDAWEVSVVDPLTGTDRESPAILDACHERLEHEGWDLAVCLTDLPVYRSGQLVVADVSAQRKVAGLSLPVLGAMRLLPRAREAPLQLVSELYARSREFGGDTPPTRGEETGAEAGTGSSDLPGQRPYRLVDHRHTELVRPFQRVEPPDEDMKNTNVDARFAAPVVQRGRKREKLKEKGKGEVI
jgi:hypothetical protein